ncbi:MAG: sodium:proton antiporter [Parafannyhessea umbonata]|uniref:Na+/H+ antiporter NhaC family protein n=1 Tax=Parafannyhessea umbonata TaxID=604330 RepID=UPI0026ED5A70|nr:Na+/H+ antiporter NhaC family protein [Parafannyhessea umbonata]MCI6681155.1 sodium:proton antiporter [Parafannyhessea umbonata]
MVEAGILLTFALVLLAGIVLGAPLLPLLVFGMLLFASYGLWRGFSAREVARMAASGLKSVGSVLTLFVLIGALTASWRAAGTIPAITCWSATLVSPRNLVLLSFLLTSGMSMLVGSSYAAAATVGVICMTIATAMKADVALVGGAILAGAFVGDRCSPMSSSAALVASITKTQVFDNVRRMVRTGAVPFALCCVVYGIAGMTSSGSAMRPSFAGSFASSFDLGWVVIVPTALILVLSLLKVSVKRTMVASLAAALLVCVFVQHISVAELPAILVFGYKCKNMAIARMVDGGGVVSMLDIALIVGVASTYSGIFRETGLLLGLRDYVDKIARHSTPFVSVLLTSIATCVIACDQVVALMLTCQLCEGTERDGSALALDLENSAAVIPSVIPWSTSCVGIVAFVGMPMTSILWNCLSVLIPLWTLAISMYQHSHAGFSDTHTARLLGLDRRDDARRLAAAA